MTDVDHGSSKSQFWRMEWGRRSIAGLIIALGWSGASAAFDLVEAARLDRAIQMPPAAHPRESYIRSYVSLNVEMLDDLPFTTLPTDFQFKPGRLVIGLFVLPGEFGATGEPGFRIVQSATQLPYAVHGGCRAVNVVADKDGHILGSWCNVDQDAQLPLRPSEFR